MKKTVVIPVMVIMVMALAGTAMAQGGYHGGNQGGGYANGPGFGPCAGVGQLFSQLTPEKQQAVKAIFDKYDEQFRSIKTQMWAKRTELRALVASGKAEKKDITSLVSSMAALKDKNYNLRKQVSDEIEQTTGIAMPVFGCDGFDMDNGRRGNGRHHRDDRRGGGCWNYNS